MVLLSAITVVFGEWTEELGVEEEELEGGYDAVTQEEEDEEEEEEEEEE